jgi:ribosomal protein L11 methylase PrmA
VLISRLELKRIKSTWNDYYNSKVSGDDYVNQKKKILEEWLELIQGNTVLDIGTNTGLFARQASAKFVNVVAIDTDSWCINDLYRESKKSVRSKVLSLCVDISEPTPAIGWNNEERGSFFARYKADVVFALALIHHMAISKNIPIPDIAEKLSQLCNFLIIEFVPKNDPRVVLMLQDRKDIFEEYSETLFEDSFSVFFIIEQKQKIDPTDRILYLMKKK